jgi:hypothetical protein
MNDITPILLFFVVPSIYWCVAALFYCNTALRRIASALEVRNALESHRHEPRI